MGAFIIDGLRDKEFIRLSDTSLTCTTVDTDLDLEAKRRNEANRQNFRDFISVMPRAV